MSRSKSVQFCAICDKVSIWLSIELIVFVHLRFISVLCRWILSRFGWSATCSNFSPSWFNVSIWSCCACESLMNEKKINYFLCVSPFALWTKREGKKLSSYFFSFAYYCSAIKVVIESYPRRNFIKRGFFFRKCRKEKLKADKIIQRQRLFLSD